MLDGRYPSDRFAELRPRIVWDRTGGTIHGRKGARQLVVTNAGTIPDRGLYGVHLPDGRRVGELDEEMVYEARPGPDLPARRHDLADRGDHPRPGDRHPGPRRPRRRALLEGRRDRPPGRARPGDRRLRPRGGLREPGGAGRRSTTSTAAPPRTSSPTCASSRRRPGSSPPTRRSSSSASATRSATGASACSRPTAAASTPPGAWRSAQKIRDERDLEADAIWSDDGIVIHLPDADEPPPADLVMVEPDELEDLVVARALRLGALRRPLPRERRPLAADPARLPRQAHAALAAAAEVAEPARGRAATSRASRSSSRPTASACATSSTCPRSPSCCATCTRASSAWSRSRRRPPRPSPPRCSSTTSPPTCTRGTRRTPSAAPPRSPSTATCCASCSARRSCAS